MDIFRADGHLTDEALAAFVQDGIVDELARLEAAELNKKYDGVHILDQNGNNIF